MIDDAALYKPSDTGKLTVRPHDTSGPLPAFSPKRPRGGWTPSAVFAAAVSYAKTEGKDVALGESRIVGLAQRALFTSLPHEVKRAQIAERLRGVDRHRDHLVRPHTGPSALPTESIDEEDDVPF